MVKVKRKQNAMRAQKRKLLILMQRVSRGFGEEMALEP